MTLAQRKACRRRYYKLKREGLCVNCGKDNREDWNLCSVCLAKAKKRSKARSLKCVQM